MKIFPVFIPNAGCPAGCVYCDQRLNSGVLQAPTPNEVVSLLEQALPPGGFDQVAFYGGSFTALTDRAQTSYLEAIRPFIDNDKVGSIRISTRPDSIDDGCVERLRRYHVDTVELGCQSFSDDVLLASGRACRAEAHSAAVKLLSDAGLKVGIQLMPGLPGGTDGEALESLNKALQLDPVFLRVYPTVVLSGTRLADDWRNGNYRPMTLDHAVDLCADMALICHAAGVPILRFGLQATAELDSGAVLAGPYHPAFGQLVKSRLWLRALKKINDDVESHVVIVHPHDLSEVLGQKRCNMQRLQKYSSALEIGVAETVQRGTIRINNNTVEMMAFAAEHR